MNNDDEVEGKACSLMLIEPIEWITYPSSLSDSASACAPDSCALGGTKVAGDHIGMGGAFDSRGKGYSSKHACFPSPKLRHLALPPFSLDKNNALCSFAPRGIAFKCYICLLLSSPIWLNTNINLSQSDPVLALYFSLSPLPARTRDTLSYLLSLLLTCA
ncbi:hypothetical protein HPP92_028036 [Vanilla planifolia]|uniref:Uncharacterized protein n=1 Tax=Vanilla planifolia TaxID=51239 RepID=A0A835U6K4_VANPL|nr:hypothetical protein HPP92_028036 [Vanilla planifolia]